MQGAPQKIFYEKIPALPIDCARRFHYANIMKTGVCAAVRSALAEGLTAALHISIQPEQIRLPARGADAGCSAALRHGADAEAWANTLNTALDLFPEVLGAPLLARVTSENGWLLFFLHGDLFSAAVAAYAADELPEDHEHYPLHRLRMLARHPSCGCPDDPAVQRALLYALAADESPTAANRARAEHALLTMAHHLPPAKRQALLARCGDVARAAARLLYGC